MKVSIVLLFISLFYKVSVETRNSLTFKDFCESLTTKITCNPKLKYRPINGRCNNINQPYLGASNTRVSRLIPSRYSDKISALPKSVTNSELPSTRLISLAIFNDTNIQNPLFTVALMQFAQVIAHDISNVIIAPTHRKCCNENGQLYQNRDKSCIYIPVPPIDKIHAGMKCLDLTRSLTDYDLNCPGFKRGSPAEQINEATGLMDLSNIYGSTQQRLNMIRSFRNGELKVEYRFGMAWPPHYPKNDSTCFIDKVRETCYFGGDPKINQNPGISMFNILFIREHNRIAKELKKLNPQWNDEILFQESRRINIAQYQNIAFYKWFSSIVGESGIRKFGLSYITSGGDYINDYNSSLVPNVFNEFVAGVFRFPHTLIEGHLRKLSKTHDIEGIIRLSDTYFRPKYIEGYGTFSNFIRGMIDQPSQSFDSNYDEEVRSYLFRNKKEFGHDLKAMDIQRGRDHGLPSYNDLREFCGLKRALKWEDFSDFILQKDIDNLKNVYADVNDVDLGVGSSLEKPFSANVVLGITYICIIKHQIKSFHSGDRYWFENDDPAIRFTPEQLSELRKSSFSRILCDNAGDVTMVQKNPFFLKNDVDNKLVKCSEIPLVNLTVFKQ